MQLAALQERCGTHESTLLRRDARLAELKAALTLTLTLPKP